MEWRCTSAGISEVQRCGGLTRPAIAMRTVLRRTQVEIRDTGVLYSDTLVSPIGLLIVLESLLDI